MLAVNLNSFATMAAMWPWALFPLECICFAGGEGRNHVVVVGWRVMAAQLSGETQLAPSAPPCRCVVAKATKQKKNATHYRHREISKVREKVARVVCI